MSAEILREAAALMRERAEAATRMHMPWDAEDEEVWTQENDGQPVFIGGRMSPRDAMHIASWHPAVALAVADQLDAMAAVVAEAEGSPLAIVATGLAEKSVAVAHLYLNREA